MTGAMIRGDLEPHKEKLLKCIGVDKALYKILGKTEDDTSKNNRRATTKRVFLRKEKTPTTKNEYKAVAPAETKSWDDNYERLKIWWNNHQNYFFSHMEQDIRVWAKDQCRKKRDGLLNEEQINLLNQIGFPWNRF